MAKTKNPSLSTKLNKSIKDLRAASDRLKEEHSNLGKGVATTMQDFIKSAPALSGFRWTQYTPYFNDGDTCEFSLNEYSVKLTDAAEKLLFTDEATSPSEEGYEMDGDGYVRLDHFDLKDLIKDRADVFNHKEMKEIEGVVKQVEKLWEAMAEIQPALQAFFGDHAQITVTKKGIDNISYDHD